MTPPLALPLALLTLMNPPVAPPAPTAPTPATAPRAPAPTTPASATPISPAPVTPAPRDVSALLKPIRAKYDLPGMVCAIVQGDRVVALGAEGVRRRGAPERLALEDRMHLGSCTKAMTATLCALMVAEGTLRWEMRVVDAFPELAGKIDPGWKDATLRTLLTNHAGAPASLDKNGVWARLWREAGTPRDRRMQLVEAVLSEPPAAAPGSAFIYSNAGFSIAGAMAERAAKVPYEELISTRLFLPLGMTSAGFGAPGTLGSTSDPRGHRQDGTPVEVGPGADNPTAIAPAGRVHASIGDWAKFIALHLRGERQGGGPALPSLTSAAFAMMHAPFNDDASHYGMGWIATERRWGGRVLTHSGSNTMWYCVAWLAPERDFAVIVATNQGGDSAAKACDEAASALISNR